MNRIIFVHGCIGWNFDLLTNELMVTILQGCKMYVSIQSKSFFLLVTDKEVIKLVGLFFSKMPMQTKEEIIRQPLL